MSRDTWQQLRPVVRTTRLNEVVTIPSFSYTAGWATACAKLNTVAELAFKTDVAIGAAVTSFSLEAWTYSRTPSSYGIELLNKDSGRDLRLSGNANGRLYIISTADALNLDTGIYAPLYSWQHFCLVKSYDAGTGNTTITLYLNGVSVYSNTSALAVETEVTSTVGIGSAGGDWVNDWLGSFNDLRYWNKALTADEVRRNHVLRLGNADANLKLNVVANIYHATEDNFVDYATGLGISGVYASQTIDTTDGPPITYGVSYIVAQGSLTLSTKCSLVYPIVAPAEADDFVVCVRWTDDDGVIHRRKLWNVAGLVMNVNPGVYSGEVLAETFYLEIWNSDGASDIVMSQDLEILISRTTYPTTEIDVTQTSAGSITMDNTIAKDSPFDDLTNPFTDDLVFDKHAVV